MFCWSTCWITFSISTHTSGRPAGTHDSPAVTTLVQDIIFLDLCKLFLVPGEGCEDKGWKPCLVPERSQGRESSQLSFRSLVTSSPFMHVSGLLLQTFPRTVISFVLMSLCRGLPLTSQFSTQATLQYHLSSHCCNMSPCDFLHNGHHCLFT